MFFQKLNQTYNHMVSTDDPLDQQQLTFNCLITAKEAEELLKLNYEGNRDLNKDTVSHYIRAMNLNRWPLHPEPLVFSKSSDELLFILLNGQHRLTAQIETGLDIAYSVCIHRDRNIYKKLDQGKVRTNADITGSHKNIVYPIQFLLRAASSIKKPVSDDVQKVLSDRAGTLLSEVEYEIKPPQTGYNLWKQTGFRAAYAMAIITNRIDHAKAFEVYTTICRNELKEWPDVFVSFYRQMMERQIHINRSGVNLDNDYFMRGMFAFQNTEAKTISIHNSFRSQVKEDVYKAMKKYATEELRIVA